MGAPSVVSFVGVLRIGGPGGLQCMDTVSTGAGGGAIQCGGGGGISAEEYLGGGVI